MKKLLVDYKGNFVRIALLKDSTLDDLIIENKNNKSIVSNIYVAIVKNILPNQFAFLDIGQEKNAFLQLNDSKNASIYSINDKGRKVLNLQIGKEVLVQVLKDATSTKGANVTTEISFTGNSIVLLANVAKRKIGVSKKITNENKRKELNAIAKKMLPKDFGIIMRTQSEELSKEDIETELDGLIQVAEDCMKKSTHLKGPFTLKEESLIGENGVKQLLRNDIDEIIINDESKLSAMETILNAKLPNSNCVIKVHDDRISLFNLYAIETVIQKLLHKKIWLKSGGFLIIEQTEACVVVDVNTGKFTSKRNQRKLFLKTNIEASKEICNQIKLRNLSGMIIIDFISMIDQDDVKELRKHFSRDLKADRVSTTIIGMTELGLMQLTRKKTREPLSSILQTNCNCCDGTGFMKNLDYIVDIIFKETLNILQNTSFRKINIKANKNVISYSDELSIFKNLEKEFKCNIVFHKMNTPTNSYYIIDKE